MIQLKHVLCVVAVLALLLAAAPLTHAQDAQSVYKTKCAMCHGPDGKGTPTGQKMGARDLTSAEVQKETDAQFTEIIGKGKNKMPGYEKSLKPEQIKGLVAYIRELGKKK